MPIVTFDTLKSVETLREAGVPETQAKAFSTAVQESHETVELATKADLREYESAIRSDLEKLETGLHHEMSDLCKDMDTKLEASTASLRHEIQESASNLKFELLKWLIGLAIMQTGLLIGFLKFFALGLRYPRFLGSDSDNIVCDRRWSD